MEVEEREEEYVHLVPKDFPRAPVRVSRSALRRASILFEELLSTHDGEDRIQMAEETREELLHFASACEASSHSPDPELMTYRKANPPHWKRVGRLLRLADK